MSLFKKIKKRGFLHSVETAFNRFVPPWLFRYSTGHVLELEKASLSAVLPSLDNSDFALTCVEQGSDARKKLREVTWNSVPEESSANDFGYSIAKQSDQEKVLGGVWGGIESFHEANLGFQLHFDDDQSWIYCAYVNKDARGMGVYKRVLSFGAIDLIEKGYERILVVIQPWNKASMYVHKKHLQKKLGAITVIRVFSICAVFTSGAVKKDRTFTSKPMKNPVRITVE